MSKISNWILLLLFVSAQQSFGFSRPAALGYAATLEAAAQIFSSPALPSLDNDGFSITPVYGKDKIEGVDEETFDQSGNSFTIRREGEINGEMAGLTLSWSRGDFGLFGIGAWSRVNGDMRVIDQYTTSDVQDIKAQSYIAAAGVSYRLIGDAKSRFAFGLFGGPAMLNSETSSKLVQPDGKTTQITLNPRISGIYLGFQLMFRFGELHLNPYVNILGNPNTTCEKATYEGDPLPQNEVSQCHDNQPGVDVFSNLAGIGINVSYGRFGFGLIKSGNGSDMAFKSTPLMFSFRINI